jgi:hypothetical protein
LQRVDGIFLHRPAGQFTLIGVANSDDSDLPAEMAPLNWHRAPRETRPSALGQSASP